jgi:Cu/Ag efflux protein CusF
MPIRSPFPATALLLFCALLIFACAKSDTHAVKGVVVDVIAEPPALVVNHEKIPGVMAAMTMQFEVDAATVATVKKGQSITARLRYTDGRWRLEDVHPAPAP